MLYPLARNSNGVTCCMLPLCRVTLKTCVPGLTFSVESKGTTLVIPVGILFWSLHIHLHKEYGFTWFACNRLQVPGLCCSRVVVLGACINILPLCILHRNSFVHNTTTHRLRIKIRMSIWIWICVHFELDLCQFAFMYPCMVCCLDTLVSGLSLNQCGMTWTVLWHGFWHIGQDMCPMMYACICNMTCDKNAHEPCLKTRNQVTSLCMLPLKCLLAVRGWNCWTDRGSGEGWRKARSRELACDAFRPWCNRWYICKCFHGEGRPCSLCTPTQPAYWGGCWLPKEIPGGSPRLAC